MMKRYSMTQLVLILTPFVFSFAFGLDIYIPILPQMVKIFDTTPSLIQLTMSLFLFFTGAGQLVIGPLSDQYGRKPVLYASSAAYALGALGCAFSTNIVGLIICRVIGALGACGMLVTSFALVRDLYSGDKNAKMYSFLNGAIGISPTFAPILGGYLAVNFGWQSVFYFLFLLGVFSFWITRRFIKETHHAEMRVRMDRAIWRRYKALFRKKQFIMYAAIAGLAEGIFFCFFSISPFIIIDLHGIPTDEFGYYFAVFGSVIALGGVASGKLIETVGIRYTLLIGMLMMLLGGISMLIWCCINAMSLQGFLIPMAVACLGAMLLVGGAASKALEPFGDIAGTAAAAFGFLEFSISAAIGSLLMLFPTNSTMPYAIFIIIISIMTLGAFAIVTKAFKKDLRNYLDDH